MSTPRVARTPGPPPVAVQALSLRAPPVPVDSEEFPESVLRDVAQNENTTRFVSSFVSTSEWELQARRRRERSRAVQGATLVTIQFLAEQFGSTTHALALFTGLAVRVIWLRRARRRRGPLVAALVAWASHASVLPEEARTVARALVSPAPFSRLAGWGLLFAGAVAPHRAFVKAGSKIVVRLARIPKIRRTLQRKWPIWGKHLLRNKMRLEVNSYRLAINEAWEVLEGTLPSETLTAMRAAENTLTTYGRAGTDEIRSDETDRDANDDRVSDDERNSNETDSTTGDDGSVTGTGGGSVDARLNGGAVGSRHVAKSSGAGFGDFDRRRRNKSGGRGSPRSSPRLEPVFEKRNSLPRAVVASVGNGPIGFLARFGGNVATRVGHVGRSVAHATLVWTPHSVFGVLTGREFGAELRCPSVETQVALAKVLEKDRGRGGGNSSSASTSNAHGMCAGVQAPFTEAQRCAFLLQYGGDPKKAARALVRSVKWRDDTDFLTRAQLKQFEDVVFVHGARVAYTGGVHLVLRLSEVHRISNEFGYDAVIGAIISHVEMQWVKLGIAGKSSDNPGRLTGRLVALVDCRGITPGTFPASLVAATLVALDSNYPELAAEVHVVNVWWLVKRFLTTLLEATSKSTRNRVRIYRGDDTGFEKLLIRFAGHKLPACFPGGRCSCRQCRRLAKNDVKFGALSSSVEGRPEFAHGGLLGRYYRWDTMSTSQKRQYLRHLFFYYVGLFTFWPVHIFRLNAHPFLVSIIRCRTVFREFLEKLRAGDPVCVFVTAVVGVTSLAFTMASLAWWAEFGAELLLQSARHPPKTWDEAWEMHGLFTKSISKSLEGSLGLGQGTRGGGGPGFHHDHTTMEDGGWV